MSKFLNSWLLGRMSAPPTTPSVPGQRVEYLEFTGSQYIDTGVPIARPSSVILDMVNAASGVTSVGLLASASDAYGLWSGIVNDCYGVGGGATIPSADVDTRVRADVIVDFSVRKTSITVGEYGASVEYGPISSDTIKIADPRYPVNIRVYGITVKLGGNIVFNGIPIRDGQVGYFYDLVSGQLFGNAGADDFVIGPDI